MKTSKRLKAANEKIDRLRHYPVEEAVGILKSAPKAKFDETIEIVFRLGVDPKHADQMVRGTVALPHGTGRTVRVLVFAEGEKETEANAAGADFVGSDELTKKIQGGWLDFDVAVATPDMMKKVGRLGKILGARGLMPNPKAGTVTMDVGKTVEALKAGRIEFRVDRQGGLAAGVGKMSFDNGKIIENVKAFSEAIIRAKPVASKGKYIISASISSTMGPGLKLDEASITPERG